MRSVCSMDLFVFINGMVAGHDVGVTYNEFKEWVRRSNKARRYALYSMFLEWIISEAFKEIRVDGTDMSATDWISKPMEMASDITGVM